MFKANYHTHTVFCDGADTPEELVKKAISRGFNAIGFSGHSYTPFDIDYCMDENKEKQYFKEVSFLKEMYRSQISVLCGIEQDYFSGKLLFPYDFVIGSVHYVKKNDAYYPVDLSAKATEKLINTVYGGDFDTLAEDYFNTVADVVKKTNADIIGHFDLVSKYSEQLGLTQSKRFLAAAESAIDALIPFGVPFEVNSGAMARGVRSVPYPSPEILKMIAKKGGTVLLSSDCHNKDFLDYGFKEAGDLIKKCGINSDRIINKLNIK